MKSKAKAVVARVAQTWPVRSFVSNLIYPTVLRCIHGEIRPDVVSPSGLMEAIAWKTHAYSCSMRSCARWGEIARRGRCVAMIRHAPS
jgi:hypothetical protein